MEQVSKQTDRAPAEKLSFTCRVAKLARILTVPPVMAAALILLLRAKRGAFTGAGMWVALFSLAILPLAAYGIWYVIPSLRARGRKAQRTLAVICSCLGYVIGSVYCVACRRGNIETVAVLTYLFSGLATALLSYGCGLKSSGHACGMSGPVAMAAIRVHPLYALGYLLLIPVAWSSLKLKRHTWRELLIGTVVPVVMQVILMCVFG